MATNSADLPSTMTAVAIVEPGAPDVLRPCEVPVPQPAAGEVLIRVAAAGVNRPDVLQRKGLYPPPPGASPLPGLEVAGTIAALGPDVGTLGIGDKVCALIAGGGYAEFAVAPAAQCLAIPAGLGFVEAAALPETVFTVWTNVFDRAHLQNGESLLVHGGTSGIGTTAIQMAKAFGATVFATAGSDEKCRACEEIGATACINYRTDDFVAAIKRLTGGRGIDVVLDMVGGDYVPRNIDVLAEDGRHVSIAFLRGPKVEVNLQKVMQKRLTLTGSTLRARPVAVKAKIAGALRRHVWPLIEAGHVRPIVHETFALADAASAHRLMEEGAHIGKIVLTINA